MPKSRERPRLDSVPLKQGNKRSNPRDELHPASIWNAIRHHSFSILEKTGDMEKALRALSDYSLPPRLHRTFGAGLKAELIFFLKNQKALQLEPLLDAGVKADFTGFREGKPVNIDVTTNVDYKDINRYSEISKKRNKLYEIAVVDLKRDRTQSFPLRFPFCPDCGKFSHYILFLDQPEGSQWWASQYQELAQYCPFCSFLKRKDSYSYLVPSPLLNLKDKMAYQHSEFEDKNFKPDVFLAGECASITRFFQKESDVLISGIAEIDYVITDPSDGDGYDSGKLLWNHPLVKSLPSIIDPPLGS